MKNGEKPMYPIEPNWVELGLTKREYFAAMAMQGTDLEAYAERYGNKWAEEVAKDSVLVADALLSELLNQ